MTYLPINKLPAVLSSILLVFVALNSAVAQPVTDHLNRSWAQQMTSKKTLKQARNEVRNHTFLSVSRTLGNLYLYFGSNGRAYLMAKRGFQTKGVWRIVNMQGKNMFCVDFPGLEKVRYRFGPGGGTGKRHIRLDGQECLSFTNISKHKLLTGGLKERAKGDIFNLANNKPTPLTRVPGRGSLREVFKRFGR